MQTIVVLIAETGETDSPDSSFKQKLDKALKRLPETHPENSEEPTPPFWTWFIENPRPDALSEVQVGDQAAFGRNR